MCVNVLCLRVCNCLFDSLCCCVWLFVVCVC